MADDKFILNVDDDWKRQAQEEKRRLVEEEQKNKPVEVAATSATDASLDAEAGGIDDDASPFGTLVQTLVTQTMVYLGVMGSQRGTPMLNLEAARRSVDMLGSLDEKTHGNLSPDEQRMLDTALYQARNQFVSVASQYIGP